MEKKFLFRNVSRKNKINGGNSMPIKVQKDLPAKKILEDENIFMMDEVILHR